MSRSLSRTSCSGSRKSNGRIPISMCFSMGTSTRSARVRGRKPGRSRRRSRARRKLENRTLLAGARIAAPMAMRKPTKKELTSVPIEHLDLEKTTLVADLVDGYKRISFQARTLGMCASVLENAMTDPQCTLFFGGAGALTPGGLRKVMRDMVEFGLVDVVVTTGAIAYHDYYEAHGHRHYATTPETDDIVLREHFLDRVYDTLADESLFRDCAGEAEVPEDRGLLRRRRDPEELHLAGRSDPRGDGIPGEPAHVRGPDHGRCAAMGRSERLHLRGEPVLGQVPQGRENGTE